MKTIKYIGPFTDGIEIAATGDIVAHNGTIEVDDDLARSLCEQSDIWEPVKKSTKPAEEN